MTETADQGRGAQCQSPSLPPTAHMASAMSLSLVIATLHVHSRDITHSTDVTQPDTHRAGTSYSFLRAAEHTAKAGRPGTRWMDQMLPYAQNNFQLSN